jgi:hypothetical protein
MIQMSETMDAFWKAFMEAQRGFEVVDRTTTGRAGSRAYNYAPLDEIQRAVVPGLHAVGIVCFSDTEHVDDEHIVTTWHFVHAESGQRLSVGGQQFRSTGDPKAQGSAQTYSRRYSLSEALGVIIRGEDDDGDAAGSGGQSRPRKPSQQPQQAANKKSSGMSDDKRKHLQELAAVAKDAGVSADTVKKVSTKKMGGKEPKELDENGIGRLLEWLEPIANERSRGKEYGIEPEEFDAKCLEMCDKEYYKMNAAERAIIASWIDEAIALEKKARSDQDDTPV